jgi:hypothetical protein
LESHFVGNLKSKVNDVVRQREDYRISPNEKIDDLIKRTTRLLIDLELVGEKKNITSVLEKVIRNLPSSLDVWAEVERERSRHDAYNIADVWASLRRKDADLSSKTSHVSAGIGLGAFKVRKQHESSVRHSGGHNTGHHTQNQRDVTCNHCGKIGHMRAECRSRLAGRALAPGFVDSTRKHNGGGQNHGKPLLLVVTIRQAKVKHSLEQLQYYFLDAFLRRSKLSPLRTVLERNLEGQIS